MRKICIPIVRASLVHQRVCRIAIKGHPCSYHLASGETTFLFAPWLVRFRAAKLLYASLFLRDILLGTQSRCRILTVTWLYSDAGICMHSAQWFIVSWYLYLLVKYNEKCIVQVGAGVIAIYVIMVHKQPLYFANNNTFFYHKNCNRTNTPIFLILDSYNISTDGFPTRTKA